GVVNEKLAFAAGWSGGSPVSVSLMLAATAVTVQFAVLGRSESGLSVIELVPEPLTLNVCGLLLQEIVNELVVTSTASLKFTVMFVFSATWSAASAGEVVLHVGLWFWVVNEKLAFAAGWSGGSPVSTSLMLAATAVTVQCAVGRSESGSSVIVSVPEPLTPNVCGLPSQTIVKELEPTVTGSLKKTWMFV